VRRLVIDSSSSDDNFNVMISCDLRRACRQAGGQSHERYVGLAFGGFAINSDHLRELNYTSLPVHTNTLLQASALSAFKLFSTDLYCNFNTVTI